MISESENDKDDLIQNFYSINPDLESNYKIKKVKFALNEDQRREIFKIASDMNMKHFVMIHTQLELGLRVNELIHLSISQLNFSQNVVIIQSRTGNKYVKSFKTKTISSNRIIPFTRILAEQLKAFIGNRKNGYVFLSNKGSHFNKSSVIHFINKYARKCKSIGRNIGSHSLRRTFASYLIKSGITVEKISKILGHASVRTTMLYLFDISDMDFDEVRKVMKKMNKRN